MHLPLIRKPCVLPRRKNDFDRYTPLAFDAMGCRFEILIDAERSSMDRGDCVAVCENLRDLVLDWHRRLSVFEPSSLASHINRATANDPICVDEDMFALLTLCEQLRERTGGAFNIACGTLMMAHGFRNDTIEDLAGLDLSCAYKLNRSDRTITKTDSRIGLDFGAIAKGFVLDLMRDELDDLGIEHAFIHGGTSSALGIGDGKDGEPWSVLIETGIEIRLNGFSMGVSELYGRSVQTDSVTSGHLMNPGSLAPATSNLSRVVCVHPSAAIADAYSTACSVSPLLIDQLGDESCTLVALREDNEPVFHDPLGVVCFKS